MQEEPRAHYFESTTSAIRSDISRDQWSPHLRWNTKAEKRNTIRSDEILIGGSLIRRRVDKIQ